MLLILGLDIFSNGLGESCIIFKSNKRGDNRMIFVLGLILGFASNFCSVNSIISKAPHYISAHDIYDRINNKICQDSEKKDLVHYLLDPQDDGQMWHLLNEVYCASEKQDSPLLRSYVKNMNRFQDIFKSTLDGQTESDFSSVIALQKEMFTSADIPFNKEFMYQRGVQKMALITPQLKLLLKLSKIRGMTDI